MSVILHHGDCLDVMKDISDASVDLIICDLPYGCLTGGGITKIETAEKYGRKGTEGISGCPWDIKIDLDAFWKEVKRIRRNEHSPTIHFCTTKFGAELIASNPKEFRYDLVWDKQRGVSFLSANKMPMRSHEMIYVFSKAGAFYNRVDEDAPGKGSSQDGLSLKPRSDNMFGNGLLRSNGADKDKACVKSVVKTPHKRSPNANIYGPVKDTVWENQGTNTRCALSVIPIVKVGTFKQQHPTAKPISLYTWLLQRYCPPGGTVLDPTFGSANSAQASWDLGLSYIGIEKDPGFFESAKKRFEAQVSDAIISHV